MTGAARGTKASRSGRAPLRLALVLCAALLVAGFVALGSWQLQRLYWKNALVERIEQRVHAAAAAPPGAAAWPHFDAGAEEYRHVRLAGIFLDNLDTRVQAVTVLGSGYWLLTPLCRADGTIVLVNRGFIPPGGEARLPAATRSAQGDACVPRARSDAAPGAVEVTGLLRISEPGGAFLRHNDAFKNRWYSRDVAAIATARGLARVAPFFVDVDADAGPPGASGQPVGGLTVIHFNNNHLAYALTWYAMALMVLAACVWLVREARSAR